MSKSIIEKLSWKYFQFYGQSPEYSFWSWLGSIGVEPIDEDLKKVLDDGSYWEVNP